MQLHDKLCTHNKTPDDEWAVIMQEKTKFAKLPTSSEVTNLSCTFEANL